MASEAPTLAVFADALAEAAATIAIPDGKTSFLEAYLEDALVNALRKRVEEDTVEARRKFDVPDWLPQPGGLDLVIQRPDKSLRLAGELKVDEIEETDVFAEFAWAFVGLLAGGRGRIRRVPRHIEVPLSEPTRFYRSQGTNSLAMRSRGSSLATLTSGWPSTCR